MKSVCESMVPSDICKADVLQKIPCFESTKINKILQNVEMSLFLFYRKKLSKPKSIAVIISSKKMYVTDNIS